MGVIHFKLSLLIFFFVGCTQKYSQYDLIRKVDFHKETYQRPTPSTEVLALGSDELRECFSQWLFFSNAEKQKDLRVPEFVRALCPGKDYLVQANFKESWWTLIFFSQSCIEIKTMCGQHRSYSKSVP